MNATDSTDELNFVLEWERWHHEHEQRRARPHGFLSITAMHWLSDEPSRFDDVPGAWASDGSDVTVQLEADEELVVNALRLVGDHRFANVDEVGVNASFGDAIVEVAKRDSLFMIRPRRLGYERGSSTA